MLSNSWSEANGLNLSSEKSHGASLAERSILYIAFHYPPILGSSGVHRTLAFSRHLSEQGWHVRVLTASLKAYERWAEDQLSFIPGDVEVIRAYARDVSRHYSWRGRYLAAMALPDNWQSWILGGVVSGLASIAKKKPKVIVSTYPVASAHIIAYVLHRLTGVPWVADLRDPMAQADYPSDPTRKKLFEWIERKIVKHCRYAIVTAPGAKAYYQEKFPDSGGEFWKFIPNGFDESLFVGIAKTDNHSTLSTNADRPLVLLHSGVIYPSERDPARLFAALSQLKSEGRINATVLEVRLRATGHDELFARELAALDIQDLVKLEPTVTYQDALSEMFAVDGLLLLQAANCNYQIPAKAYEYLRVQKPILALTPPDGDTGRLLANLGVAEIAPLDDTDEIKRALSTFIAKLQTASPVTLDEKTLNEHSRQYQAIQLESLLEQFTQTLSGA